MYTSGYQVCDLEEKESISKDFDFKLDTVSQLGVDTHFHHSTLKILETGLVFDNPFMFDDEGSNEASLASSLVSENP